MNTHDKIMIGCLFFAIGAFVFIFGTLVWGMSMLTDTMERQEQNRQEYQHYILYEKPLREELMKQASELGYSNNDLIMNMTGLCWYNSDDDSLFGQCVGERERIDQINAESKNQNYTWANPEDISIVWVQSHD